MGNKSKAYIIILLLIVTAVSIAACSQKNGSRFVAEFKEIPFEAADLTNPLRGWYNSGPAPADYSDAYRRFEWRDLEPEKDKYDFTVIEQFISENAAAGRKSAFRVRALVSLPIKEVCVPDYLIGLMEKGWWHDVNGDGVKETYVPDWNDPDFLERAEKLIMELGKKYNNDPRVAWVDIGMYGDWGEFHMQKYPYPDQDGAKPVTDENAKRIIDMHVAAFPDKLLVFRTSNEWLGYVTETYPEVGLRSDAVGDTVLDHEFLRINQYPYAKERWKTAPVIAEPIYPFPPGSGMAERMRKQVQAYHFANLNNLNFERWDTYSSLEQTEILLAGKLTGYRFVLHRVEADASVAGGEEFVIRSEWRNLGVTPAYQSWDVCFELRNPKDGRIVWKGASKMNLRTLLPTDRPVSIEDRFIMPVNIPAGTYDLVLEVLDPDGVTRPMKLAIEGRREDGSYLVGTVRVQKGKKAKAGEQAHRLKIDFSQGDLKSWEQVSLSGAASYSAISFLNDYRWEITSRDGFRRVFSGANISMVFKEPGNYTVKLTVKDSQGVESSISEDFTVIKGPNAPESEKASVIPAVKGKTAEFNAVADTYVRDGNMYTNFGSELNFVLKNGEWTWYRRAFLKFDISEFEGTNCKSAKIILYCDKLQDGLDTPVKVYAVDDDSWTEDGITYANMPEYDAFLDKNLVTEAHAYYEFDITDYVREQLDNVDKVISLCLLDDSTANRWVIFASKEAGKPPVLKIVY